MKRKILIVCISFVSLFVYSQNAILSENQKVGFGQNDGALQKKEFYSIGSISGVRVTDFQNLITTNTLTGNKSGKLRVHFQYEADIPLLDLEEINTCIKSMRSLQNFINTKVTCYTEYVYRSKDGLELGAYANIKDKHWTVFIRIAHIENVINANKLDELISVLEKSLSDLKSKIN